MIVGVTGARNGMTLHQERELRLLIHRLDIIEFHHGDCVGVDSEAHDIVLDLFPDAQITIHPPTDPKYRAWRHGNTILEPLPYLERNRKIVDSVDLMVGVPDGPERKRSGTWSTIRYTKSRQIPLRIVHPDGDLQIV